MTAETPPSGTVSFLFTDIEGSTARWERHADVMRDAVRRHDELLRTAIGRHRGHIFKTMGDAFYVAFYSVKEAVRAAHESQRSLGAEDFSAVDGLRVRMAIHVGAVESRDGDYFGHALNKLSRMLNAGHGGQVLISDSAAALLAEDPAGGLALSSLGDHRLKDLESPVHVYQLQGPDLLADFPPLRTLSLRPNNLPIALTSFIGREDEVRTLRETLHASRILTLVGPGGVGKTRLALQIGAESVDRFADGAWFIDLVPIALPEVVASEAATTIGVKVGPGQSATEALAGFFHERSALLIVDNCEHVAAAVAELISAVTRRSAGVHSILTSRQALGLEGEIVHTVSTLPLPPEQVDGAAQAAAYSSVGLFVDRARAAGDKFTLDDANAPAVARICRRLDGIPLAIELAAARTTILSPRAILDRLNERFKLLTHGSRDALQRHQTLQSTIDWSYELLDERERRIFQSLAVFAGGWTLEAAAGVCAGDGLNDWDTFELVASLVAKSLVSTELSGDEQRYYYLESLRDYAGMRLRESGQRAGIEARHCRFYAAFLEDKYAGLNDDEAAWKSAVAPEIDNIRTALAWSMDHDVPTGLRVLAALAKPDLIFAVPEALAAFERGAEALGPQTPALVSSRILRFLSRLERWAGMPISRQTETMQRGVEAAIRSENEDEKAYAFVEQAMVSYYAGDLLRADDALERAHESAARSGERMLSFVLHSWAINDLNRGDVQRARDRFAQVANIGLIGTEGTVVALMNLAETEFALGNISEAVHNANLAKKQLIALGHPLLGVSNSNLAAYALAQDDLPAAREFLRAAVEQLQSAGRVDALTPTLELYALLAALCGGYAGAAKMLGYTSRQYTQSGRVREITETSFFTRLDKLLAENLEPAALEGAQREGALLTRQQALSLALSIDKHAVAYLTPKETDRAETPSRP